MSMNDTYAQFSTRGSSMTYEITITLTEDEYKALVAAATREGKEPEEFLRDMVRRLPPVSEVKRPLTGREFMELQYREGELINLPDPQQVTQEEAERERFIQSLSGRGGKSISEMVIEDRGPYG